MQAVRSWVVGLTIAAVWATCFSGAAGAATIHQIGGPAETPPPSFTERQYVDSRGCLFVRVGSRGNEQWVPRATRGRQVMCGYRPSLSGAQARAAAQQPAARQTNGNRAVRRGNYIEVIPDQEAYRYAQEGVMMPSAGATPRATGNRARRNIATGARAVITSGPATGAAVAPQQRVVRRSNGNILAWLFGQPRQRRVVRQPQVAAVQPPVVYQQRQTRVVNQPQQRVVQQQPQRQVVYQQPRQQVVYQQPQRQVVYRQPQVRVAVGNGPFSNPPAGTPVNRPVAVAGNASSVYWTAGNERGLAVRYGPQQMHPSDYYRAYQAQPRYQAQQGYQAQPRYRAPSAYVTPQTRQVYVRPQAVAANPYANSPQAYYWTAGNQRNLAVRYGPQAVHPADYYVTRQRPATAGYVAGGRQVYAAAQAPVVIPPGYEAVYPEGRLNPNRGVPGGARVQGFGQGAGVYAPADASSYAADGGVPRYVTPAAPTGRRLMWTSYMPHKLYDVTTGQDVTAMYPELQYPYTDLALQRQHLSGVGRGTTRRRARGGAPQVPSAPALPQSPSMEDDASPVNMGANVGAVGIEDTAAPATQGQDVKVFQPSRARYVQVGTFAQPDNATRLQARFEGQGLPTHSRPLVRGNTRYNIVLLGPFSDEAALGAALRTARNAGFRDAFTVN